MKTKIMKLGSLVCDKSFYPRAGVNPMTVNRYAASMKADAEFPPIVAAKWKGKFVVVDGFHRLEALKSNKETHTEVEILDGLNEQQIFVEAVKRNISHGLQFSSYERTKIILTLEKWNMSEDSISQIVRIPATEIEPFVAKRTVRITETQEEIPIKFPLRHLAGTEVSRETLDNMSELGQHRLTGQNALSLMENLILLLKNNWVNVESAIVQERAKELYHLLGKSIELFA